MVRFICGVCKKVLFVGLTDGESEEQIITMVCGVCNGRIQKRIILYPPILNDLQYERDAMD